MATVEGTEGVIQFLTEKITEFNSSKPITVAVGYTAAYAIWVHENLEARHKKGKQAKYLEQPFRELQDEIQRIISETFLSTGNLKAALILAGLRVQRESQKIVPVDTGNLKGSAFTRVES